MSDVAVEDKLVVCTLETLPKLIRPTRTRLLSGSPQQAGGKPTTRRDTTRSHLAGRGTAPAGCEPDPSEHLSCSRSPRNPTLLSLVRLSLRFARVIAGLFFPNPKVAGPKPHDARPRGKVAGLSPALFLSLPAFRYVDPLALHTSEFPLSLALSSLSPSPFCPVSKPLFLHPVGEVQTARQRVCRIGRWPCSVYAFLLSPSPQEAVAHPATRRYAEPQSLKCTANCDFAPPPSPPRNSLFLKPNDQDDRVFTEGCAFCVGARRMSPAVPNETREEVPLLLLLLL